MVYHFVTPNNPSTRLMVSHREMLLNLYFEVSWFCMARLSLAYVTPNAMNNLPRSGLEVIFLRSLLALRAMDFFSFLTTMTVLKIKWYKYRLNIYNIYFKMTWLRNGIKRKEKEFY